MGGHVYTATGKKKQLYIYLQKHANFFQETTLPQHRTATSAVINFSMYSSYVQKAQAIWINQDSFQAGILDNFCQQHLHFLSEIGEISSCFSQLFHFCQSFMFFCFKNLPGPVNLIETNFKKILDSHYFWKGANILFALHFLVYSQNKI